MANGSTTWNFTYDANGMRTSRTNGSTTYSYVYNGSQLTQMTVGSNTLRIGYDTSGPLFVKYNGTTYIYATNLQGDVIAILTTSGTPVVEYTYDAWGNILTTTGSMASTLGVHNPLRYRGYVYDTELGLYYLQSRYYNPEMGRFINADAYTSTGQGILGNNMFAYCNNNPVVYCDPNGFILVPAAFEFLDTWLIGDGSKQYYDEDSDIVKALKKSRKMQSLINNAIDNYRAGIENKSGTGEFTHAEDGWELYLSTQHFSYEITVESETRTIGFWFWKHDEIRYVATVVVYDIYNFDSLRPWDGFGNMLNNGAYILNVFGIGNDYTWYATYTYSTRWEDVS